MPIAKQFAVKVQKACLAGASARILPRNVVDNSYSVVIIFVCPAVAGSLLEAASRPIPLSLASKFLEQKSRSRWHRAMASHGFIRSEQFGLLCSCCRTEGQVCPYVPG